MAITQVYVDPAIAGNSGTGTIGDPYGDLQYALNTKARDAVNGDQFNVKAGTAEFGAISLATYGTPTYAAPLVIRGYTAAANDGGRATLDGSGAAIINEVKDFIHLIDLRFTNCGATTPVTIRHYCLVEGCQFDTATGNQFMYIQRQSQVLGCYFVGSPAARALYCDSASVRNCYFKVDTGFPAIWTVNVARPFSAFGNVILLTHASGKGILLEDGYNMVANNCIIKTAASAASMYGISAGANVDGLEVWNNIIVGFNGTTNTGILSAVKPILVGYNAFYNNTANESYASDPVLDLGGDVALAADPFVDAANGDFSLTAAAKAALRGVGWPASYLGAHANTDGHITIGAIQYGEAEAGGGGGPVIGSRIIRGLGAV